MLKKPSKTSTNTIYSILPKNKTLPKSKQQIDKEHYQKNKEKKKAQQKDRYEQKKKQERLLAQKYYQASNIKVLLTLKEYTELSKEKHKIWLDFAWILKDLNEKGISQIEEIMKLRESAENLIKDYRETAINETKKGQSWNSLSEEHQNKLIKYWAKEKVRKENELTKKLTEWKNQTKEYEKELELAKFHEERGKIKCECWQCQESKRLQEEINKELFNDNEKSEEKQEKIKAECANCYQYQQVDKESGLCGKCGKE